MMDEGELKKAQEAGHSPIITSCRGGGYRLRCLCKWKATPKFTDMTAARWYWEQHVERKLR